jgi:phosphomannomutase
MKARGDPEERARTIRFGTSGWRGVLGEEFTFERVRAVVAAAGDRIAAGRPGARVLVGHDRRFLGPLLAATAVRVLAGRGLRPITARGAIPTPVLASAIRPSRAAAGLIFTASHTPPEYQGLKLFGPSAAGWSETETHALERAAARWLRVGAPPERDVRPRPVDLVGPYLGKLLELLDRRALRRSGLRVVYDAMHGAGAGVVDEALRRAGIRVVALRSEPDPAFGGEAPDPLPERLGALRSAVRALRGRALGLASDGDADRFAVVDSGGFVLSETDAVALLVDHLARTGRVRRGVAVSCATGGLVERVAREHGLAVSFHPLGFKHLSGALMAGEADVAGEESGGFAFAPFAHDKDGILAACLMAEVAATSGEPLRSRLRALERRLGASASGRTAIPGTAAIHAALERLMACPPDRVGRDRVRSALCRDGVRLALDDGFLMLRASGTEPLVRVYADAPTTGALRKRLKEGIRLLQRA